MSKKLKDLHWQPVAVEGFPVINSDTFQGFVGLEECTDYGLDKESKKSKKKKIQKPPKDTTQTQDRGKKRQQVKRKSPPESENINVPSKKVKLSNGFIVESCTSSVAPSQTHVIVKTNNKKHNKKKNKLDVQSKPQTEAGHMDRVARKESQPSLGELTNTNVSELTPEDMLSWAEFKLQEPIVKALAELGFKNPTKIQQLTLPAAIHGRRDILGAAETGSGKTLAFGLPILSGILMLKEKAAAKGLDVHDIPFKKPSVKKKRIVEEKPKEKSRKGQKNTQNKSKSKEDIETSKKRVPDMEAKQSSEDGYSSGEHDSSASDAEVTTQEHIKHGKLTKSALTSDDEFIEEIDVPIKKRDSSVDEGNDSDDENYLHLSEMLDSDDLADDSDDDPGENDDNEENNNVLDSDADEIENDLNEHAGEEQSDEEDVILGDDCEQNEGDETSEGVGCVRVVDNIEPHDGSSKPLLALILTPTRELAMQVSRHLIAVAKYTGIRVATVVGGMAAVKQERLLRRAPEVVVATPGRLWELLAQGHPHLQHLHNVKFLAVDETDRMVERGHFEELHALLQRLNAHEHAARARQNFVFSATLTLVHELPAHLRHKKAARGARGRPDKMTPQHKLRRLVRLLGITDAKVVDITADNAGSAASLTECAVWCAPGDKDACLYYILRLHPARTIVFCNSIGSVRRLTTILSLLQVEPLPLHGGMPQRQRLNNLERFGRAARGVLVATDVAARGLDVPDVLHVVQYHVPRTAENYLHRSGRTARANKEGLNVALVEPAEARLYHSLRRTLHKQGEVARFPLEAGALAALRAAVRAARDLDALLLRRRRAAHAQAWRARAERDMDIIIDHDDLPAPAGAGAGAAAGLERAVKAARRALAAALARPLLPRGFSFLYPTLNDPRPNNDHLHHHQDNALQVMKKALESGQLKKEKRLSKNASLLQLAARSRNRNNQRKNNKKHNK